MDRGSIKYQKLLTAGLKQKAPLMLNLTEGETAEQVSKDLLDIMEGHLCMRSVSDMNWMSHVILTPEHIKGIPVESLTLTFPQISFRTSRGIVRREKALLYFHRFDEYTQSYKDIIYDIALDRKIDGVDIPEGWRIAFSVEKRDMEKRDMEPVTIIDPAFLNKMFLIALGGPA
jgi:hypothetical protein